MGHSLITRIAGAGALAGALLGFGASAAAEESTYFGHATISLPDSAALAEPTQFAEMVFIDDKDEVIGVLKLGEISVKSTNLWWTAVADTDEWQFLTAHAAYAMIETEHASLFWETDMNTNAKQLQILAANQINGVMDETPWDE